MCCCYRGTELHNLEMGRPLASWVCARGQMYVLQIESDAKLVFFDELI